MLIYGFGGISGDQEIVLTVDIVRFRNCSLNDPETREKDLTFVRKLDIIMLSYLPPIVVEDNTVGQLSMINEEKEAVFGVLRTLLWR